MHGQIIPSRKDSTLQYSNSSKVEETQESKSEYSLKFRKAKSMINLCMNTFI